MHRIMYKETLRLRRVETTHITTKQFPHAYASDSLCQSVYITLCKINVKYQQYYPLLEFIERFNQKKFCSFF